jgi:type IV pilus assembly protein PilW
MHNRGFSLVEIMVAMALVVLIVAGALALVAGGRKAYRSQESRSRLEETANAALESLTHEIRMAGFLGPLPPGTPVAGSMPVGDPPPTGLYVAGGCVESLALDLATPIAGADGSYAARPGVPLGCSPSPPGASPVAGSDTLVVRRVATAGGTADAGRLQLEADASVGRLMADGSRRLGPTSRIHDLEVSAFYVSEDTSGEPGRPSLRRKRLVGGSAPAFQDEELVPGVIDLQVEAGLDLDGDGTEDMRSALVDVHADATVQSVYLWVLVRSDLPEAVGSSWPALAYADRRLDAEWSRWPRLLATRSVRLRNPGDLP